MNTGIPAELLRTDPTEYRALYRQLDRSKEYEESRREQKKAYYREWRKNNLDKKRMIAKRWQQSVRDKVIDLYGGKCNKCGFPDRRALQIDHKNGVPEKEKKSHIRGGHGLGSKILNGTKHKDDYQILCANCNWIKRYEADEVRRHMPKVEITPVRKYRRYVSRAAVTLKVPGAEEQKP